MGIFQKELCPCHPGALLREKGPRAEPGGLGTFASGAGVPLLCSPAIGPDCVVRHGPQLGSASSSALSWSEVLPCAELSAVRPPVPTPRVQVLRSAGFGECRRELSWPEDSPDEGKSPRRSPCLHSHLCAGGRGTVRSPGAQATELVPPLS